MKLLKKLLSGALVLLFFGYFLVLGWFYVNQESLIFNPDLLPSSYPFSFNNPFTELAIQTGDGAQLHGLLFEADSSKGLVFYLHGNRGALDRWGDRADLYLENGFDVFMLDYRGYGKSTGTITSEAQFLDDVDRAYLQVYERYIDKPIVVIGYSLGTGPASYLAETYDPELLVLMAPYFSIPDLASSLYPFIPSFLSKYELANHRYLPGIESRVVIFHGDRDQLIDINASERLSTLLSPPDTLIVLENQGHSGMHRNPAYRREIARLLNGLDL